MRADHPHSSPPGPPRGLRRRRAHGDPRAVARSNLDQYRGAGADLDPNTNPDSHPHARPRVRRRRLGRRLRRGPGRVRLPRGRTLLLSPPQRVRRDPGRHHRQRPGRPAAHCRDRPNGHGHRDARLRPVEARLADVFTPPHHHPRRHVAGGRGSAPGDLEAMRSPTPTHIVFNGVAGALQGDGQLTAKVGENVLIVHAQANRRRPRGLRVGARGLQQTAPGGPGDVGDSGGVRGGVPPHHPGPTCTCPTT